MTRRRHAFDGGWSPVERPFFTEQQERALARCEGYDEGYAASPDERLREAAMAYDDAVWDVAADELQACLDQGCEYVAFGDDPCSDLEDSDTCNSCALRYRRDLFRKALAAADREENTDD